MNRPEKFLLFFLFILLPSQLAFHFWPSWSLIYGVRVDYLSPTLYFTDLLIIGLFFSSRLRIRVAFPVIIFIVLNTLNSTLPLLTIYKWVRVLEYFWLFKYLISIQHLAFSIQAPLSLSVLWTSSLAWMQLVKQSSVGGLAWWFGERTFSISTPGIAKIQIFNNWLTGQLGTGELLRVYATLPHPNALAGFLLVSGLIIYFQKTQSKKLLSIEHCLPAYLAGALGIAALTVPITFSRTAIALEILILLIWIKPLIFKILLLFFSFYFLVSITGSAVSIPNRISLNHLAISTIKKSPLFGVGLGSFIPASFNYARQPVHNIYLLLASELGLPSLVFLSLIVIKSLRRILSIKRWALSIAILVVATTGLADHYWLTLHQNILLLVVLLAIIKVQFMTTNDNL